ncbi:hypothetical protein DFR70_10457 [Nocardia tenerifensis]|uniref:Nudix hydrolase domain-containing protein n=1 Tax=Nocardia tenerifensis TaxID=228006 RepID=A0A318K649_9NOCA|nr:hypothetical protein [Nocardia tenerifensis]PXX64996.1 hypothetical protein DFR70_10457 [Nocardia tenerifensis]
MRHLLAIKNFVNPYIRSFIDKRRVFVRYEWPSVVGILSLGANIVISALLHKLSPLSITFAVSSVGVWAYGYSKIRKARESYHRPDRLESGILRSMSDDLASRILIVEGEVFLPLSLPKSIAAGSNVVAGTAVDYDLPQPLRALLPVVILTKRDRALIMDRPGLGLADIGDSRMDVRKLTYFQHLASNNAFRCYARPYGQAALDVLNSYVFRDNGGLVDFSESEFPNLIGISTLATVEDGRIFIVESDGRNSGSPRLIHPSGSGSMEPKDLSEKLSPHDLIVRAMERELCEESSVRHDEIDSTEIIGFARWINKGAMPEFFGLTRTRVRADVLERRRPEGEDPLFVRKVVVTNLRVRDISVPVVGRRADLRGFDAIVAGSCSGPLGVLLWLVSERERAKRGGI